MRRTTVAWMMLTTALASAGATLWMMRPAPVVQHDTTLLDPVILVGEVQTLARLETAIVPLQTTVHGARGEGVLRTLAGEELVFQGIGEARAGVDLGQLDADDLWIDGTGAVWVDLPPGEIFGVELDTERSQVLVREQGWFGRPNAQFETQARRVAVRQLTAQAQVMGLVESAREPAQVVVTDLLKAAGVAEVQFVGSDPSLW